MSISVPVLLSAIALLIAMSALYNAYLLHGGKLAWSEMLIAIGMFFLAISLTLDLFLPNPEILPNVRLADISSIVGLVSLLVASLKLRSSIKA